PFSPKYENGWLWNNTFYKQGGPIFFYTGNEGGIEGFAKATGMMWDLAPMFHAAIIFAEHRFYGDTLPFGNLSFSSINNLGFLTSEQALADFATQNNTWNYSYPKDTPVIAFGGSYGGMLSAWLRIKYPHLVNGAWASSAPLIYFRGGGVDQGAFDAVTTATYLEAGCNRFIVENSWNAIVNLSSTKDGQNFLNTQFRIDPKSQINSTDGGWNLNGYFREAIEYMAMVDYPYATSFLMPLPGWPVKVACSFMSATGTKFSDKELATMMYKAANVYYNSSGKLQHNCIDPAVCGDIATASLGEGLAWPWQECSEIVIDMCSKGGKNDFFWDECKSNWTGFLAKVCKSTFKSQGLLDPWSGGGYKASSPDNRNDHGIYVVEIPGSAHHLDLRKPNSCDPNTIKNARYQAKCYWCFFQKKKSRIDDFTCEIMASHL
ncbi:unnamed protein product, partial [Angiostrongylus costaricensis]|uniref:Peptidase_S9 domain-containing protein n=1 Tax=Angiostrongylus costaricensis TaxID=334426 RepID=A0A158PDW5_ANGCS